MAEKDGFGGGQDVASRGETGVKASCRIQRSSQSKECVSQFNSDKAAEKESIASTNFALRTFTVEFMK